MSRTTLLATSLLLLFLLIVALKNCESSKDGVVLKKESVVLAFGDSLTYGFGAKKESSYPKFFEKKTALTTVNAGINGELSQEGVLRLPSLLQKNNPDIVILCHGGNDILNRRSPHELKNNLLAMIALIKESGAEVLLVGVPDFSLLSFGVHEVYEEVADETGVLFEDSILTKIELDRRLKSDYVHPNAAGYEMMADAFIEKLNL